MTSRYNNNDDGTPLLVCPRRAGKMEQMYDQCYILVHIRETGMTRRNASSFKFFYCSELIIVKSTRAGKRYRHLFYACRDMLKNDLQTLSYF